MKIEMIKLSHPAATTSTTSTTTRPEDQGTRGQEDRGTRGPEDRGTRGPEDQGTRGPKKKKNAQKKKKTIPKTRPHPVQNGYVSKSAKKIICASQKREANKRLVNTFSCILVKLTAQHASYAIIIQFLRTSLLHQPLVQVSCTSRKGIVVSICWYVVRPGFIVCAG